MRYLIAILLAFGNTVIYGAAEFERKDNVISFPYDAEKVRVDAYNIIQTSGVMTNKFVQPTEDEVAFSTSCRSASDYRRLVSGNKNEIWKVISKEKQELLTAETVGDVEKIQDSNARIGIFVKEYQKK